jgi:hypothetical protein
MALDFRSLPSLTKQMGFRWTLYRLGDAIRMKTGLIRLQMPIKAWEAFTWKDIFKSHVPSAPQAYRKWKEENTPQFFFHGIPNLPKKTTWNTRQAVKEADELLKGKIKYFSNVTYKTGFPPDWSFDPYTGTHLDGSMHWSRIPEEGKHEIKFVWEASRFSFVYTLVRAYAASRNEKYARAFWDLVLDWASNNPPNRGPNWMNGQEIALRLMAWIFGLHAFMRSPATTPERLLQFSRMVAIQALRIRQNIQSALATRGNHAISEAFALWMVGLLFPEIKGSEGLRQLGKRLLEQQTLLQLFDDGTYSMYSLNYQRFVLQLLFVALPLGRLNGENFSGNVKKRLSKALDFLSRLVEPETGQMPEFGSNDGALVFPLNSCDYSDYRPLLQLGSMILRGTRMFRPGNWDEDIFWLMGEKAIHSPSSNIQRTTHASFPDGGVYLLQGAQNKAVIRCTQYRERPSHADQLHLDLWWHGVNVACDAGTYLYHGKGAWQNGLAHTDVHNTVTVDGMDQMTRMSRFTWVDWSNGKVLRNAPGQRFVCWKGEQDGYNRLKDPVGHRRAVLMLDDTRWLVVDWLAAIKTHAYRLHWLLADFPFISNKKTDTLLLTVKNSKLKVQTGTLEKQGRVSVVRGDPNSTRGWRSRYYGAKSPAISLVLEKQASRVCFWTFFGSADDTVQAIGDSIIVKTRTRIHTIDLNELRENI